MYRAAHHYASVRAKCRYNVFHIIFFAFLFLSLLPNYIEVKRICKVLDLIVHLVIQLGFQLSLSFTQIREFLFIWRIYKLRLLICARFM